MFPNAPSPAPNANPGDADPRSPEAWRAKAEEDLRRSEQKYRALFESIDEGFCLVEMIYDAQGAPVDMLFVETNPAFARHTGLELAGKRAREAIPEYERFWLDLYAHVDATGEVARREHPVKGLGGRWFQVSAFRFGSASEHRVGIVFSDITPRKAEEQALKDFNARLEREVASRTAELHETLEVLRLTNDVYRQAEEIAGMGTWTWNPATNKAVYSDNMFRLFGMRPQEVEPDFDTIPPFIHPEDRPRLLEAAARLKADPTRGASVEYRVNRRDGAQRIFMNRIRQVRDVHGAPLVAGVTEDITDRRQAEEEARALARVHRKQEERQREKQRLELLAATLDAQETERKRIAESLHNGIGQLLYGIQLNLDQLHLRPGTAWLPRHEEQHRATQRLLTGAIEETRRISHELVPNVLEDFGLQRAMDEMCRQYHGLMDFDCTFEGLPAAIEPYLEIALYRSAQELVTNIVKHARAQRIGIELRYAENAYHLRVRDNGKGFEASRKMDGIGLKGIRDKVTLLGGDFDIETGPSGTTVRIRIPDRER